MNIPVEIEIGCMVFVVLSHINDDQLREVVEKWCKVIDVYNDSVKIEEMSFRIPLYAIEYFTFGNVKIPNPDFNFQKILKMFTTH